MVKAMMWAAGPVNRIAASGEESDTAEVKGRHFLLFSCNDRTVKTLPLNPVLAALWCATFFKEQAVDSK